jgi:hypothetical protein
MNADGSSCGRDANCPLIADGARGSFQTSAILGEKPLLSKHPPA